MKTLLTLAALSAFALFVTPSFGQGTACTAPKATPAPAAAEPRLPQRPPQPTLSRNG